MNEAIYVVKRGDSLSKIAKIHGTRARVIADLNGISNINLIRVGQRLRLPVPLGRQEAQDDERSNARAPRPADVQGAGLEDSPYRPSSVLLQFFDVVNQPIKGLKLNITTSEGVISYVTDDLGQVPEIEVIRSAPEVKVEVEKLTGGTKEIAKFNAALGFQHVVLTSPKLRVSSSQRPHEGAPPPARIPAAKPAAPAPRNIPVANSGRGKASPAAPMPPKASASGPKRNAASSPSSKAPGTNAAKGSPEKQAGTVTETRSPAGHPVAQTTLECPNPENLRLGRNFKYRNIIIAAGKRSGFMPQAIAAIMNAEAATITEVSYTPVLGKNKKPLIDKKTGKPKTKKVTKNYGEWNPRSASPASSARGMTQFLDASWVDNALTSGTRLNQKIVEKGWLTSTTVKNKKGKEKTVPAFKLASGDLVVATPKRSLARVLSGKPYITARATASDANLQALLDMRFDAECAIDAAVDYGTINLKGLKDDLYDLSKLNDGERAKIVYLCHHLGLVDAKRFIQNTITEKRAKLLLVTQVGTESAAEYANAAGGEYIKGHRNWLNSFENGRITLAKYMCDPSKAPVVRDLTVITDSIKI